MNLNGRLHPLDVFGLRPVGPALAPLRRVVLGGREGPATQLGPSSVRIFKPHIGLPTWAGRKRRDGLVWLYNFFNRNRQPSDQGYSVKVTHCRDFAGGQWTYDGHLGTDFACPVGTRVVAGAPGVVLRVSNELDHGGLKVCVDHGEGLFTTHNHLARALVDVGERVTRGQPVGLSGASGLEFFLFFPWVSPHLHYNIWVDGQPADPFALPGEESVWRRRNHPRPSDGAVDGDDRVLPSTWDADGVDAAIAACKSPRLRAKLLDVQPLPQRAAAVLLVRSYRRALFESLPPLYRTAVGRRPRLDLPFRREDFRGVWLPHHAREAATSHRATPSPRAA
jgi:murein DD-endopeptidase MepM/ murein hydrolase activator NlpD